MDLSTSTHASGLKPSNSMRTSRASSRRSLCTRCISANPAVLLEWIGVKLEQGPESYARSGPFHGRGRFCKRESGTSHPVRLVVGSPLAQKQLDPATILLSPFINGVQVKCRSFGSLLFHANPPASTTAQRRSSYLLRLDSSASAEHPKEWHNSNGF